MDIMLREFGRYVQDVHRTELFARAIEKHVGAGSVVVDLGAGFGLLAMMCARQGASRVYAIEQGPYIGLGAAIVRDNGLDSKIEWLHGNSATVDIPQKADVIVSETLGQFALEEFTVEYLWDAARRFGKPGVRIIPHRIELAVAPAASAGLRTRLRRTYGAEWESSGGFDLRRLRQAVLENDLAPYVVVEAGDISLLGPPSPIADFALGAASSSRFVRRVASQIDKDGLCDGWLAMFKATLTDGIELSTFPGAPSTHWNSCMFPLLPSVQVAASQSLGVTIGFCGAAGWSYRPDRAPNAALADRRPIGSEA